jgi:hypothetical protein
VAEPRLWVEQAGEAEPLGGKRWATRWRVQNRGPHPVRLHEAWLPHGRWRGERQDVSALGELAAGETRELAAEAWTDGAPGEEIENAFVILRVESGGETWRVFARLRIVVDAAGRPRARTESITVARHGDS